MQKPASPLILAVQALEEELASFDRSAHDMLKLRLDSGRNLERATKSLGELAASEDRLGGKVSAVVAAIEAARRRQAEQAQAVSEKAVELQKRMQEFQSLADRFGTIGEQARPLTEALKAGQGAEVLADVANKMQELADRAHGFGEEAKTADFPDLERQADALRQQILSLRAKVIAAQKAKS